MIKDILFIIFKEIKNYIQLFKEFENLSVQKKTPFKYFKLINKFL